MGDRPQTSARCVSPPCRNWSGLIAHPCFLESPYGCPDISKPFIALTILVFHWTLCLFAVCITLRRVRSKFKSFDHCEQYQGNPLVLHPCCRLYCSKVITNRGSFRIVASLRATTAVKTSDTESPRHRSSSGDARSSITDTATTCDAIEGYLMQELAIASQPCMIVNLVAQRQFLMSSRP
jgi:hypothetical protein